MVCYGISGVVNYIAGLRHRRSVGSSPGQATDTGRVKMVISFFRVAIDILNIFL